MSLLRRIGTPGTGDGVAPGAGTEPVLTDDPATTGSIAGSSRLNPATTGSLGTTGGLARPVIGSGQRGPQQGAGPQRPGGLNTIGSSGPRVDSFNDLKSRIQNRLIAELDPRMDLSNADEVRR